LVKAVFLGYKGGRRTRRNKHIQVKIDQVDNRNEAAKYIGKKFTWKTPRGNTITGKVVSVHGGNGILNASSSKGLPGQAVGEKLDIS